MKAELTKNASGAEVVVANAGSLEVGKEYEVGLDFSKFVADRMSVRFLVTGAGKPFARKTHGGWLDEEDARSFGGTGQMMRIAGSKEQVQYYYGRRVA